MHGEIRGKIKNGEIKIQIKGIRCVPMNLVQDCQLYQTHISISGYEVTNAFRLVQFRDNPAERLGYQKGGLKDIMKHR